MKKLFTLIAAALMAVSVNAQTSESLILTGNTWNVSYPLTGTFTLTSSNGWGEFKLTTATFAVSDYKGYKVEYAYPSGATEVTWQMKIVDENKNESYKELAVDQTTVESDFSSTLSGNISYFELQALTANTTLTVNKVTLVKADGTEVQLTDGASNWGTSAAIDQSGEFTINFTGQYGGQQLALSDGTLCSHATTDTDIYTYTLVLAEATTDDVLFELDDTSNKGYAWYNIDKGLTEYSFTVDPSTLSADCGSIYLKYSGTTSYSLKIKSLTRVKSGSTTAISSVKAAAEDSNVYYNLSGQRVAKPSKGLYIQNGKKVIVK